MRAHSKVATFLVSLSAFYLTVSCGKKSSESHFKAISSGSDKPVEFEGGKGLCAEVITSKNESIATFEASDELQVARRKLAKNRRGKTSCSTFLWLYYDKETDAGCWYGRIGKEQDNEDIKKYLELSRDPKNASKTLETSEIEMFKNANFQTKFFIDRRGFNDLIQGKAGTDALYDDFHLTNRFSIDNLTFSNVTKYVGGSLLTAVGMTGMLGCKFMSKGIVPGCEVISGFAVAPSYLLMEEGWNDFFQAEKAQFFANEGFVAKPEMMTLLLRGILERDHHYEIANELEKHEAHPQDPHLQELLADLSSVRSCPDVEEIVKVL